MTKILIVTGGSGGHVIPALTIFDHLKNNFDVRIATDERGTKFINKQDYEYNLIKVQSHLYNPYQPPKNELLTLGSFSNSFPDPE